jgi:hypothetical protein
MNSNNMEEKKPSSILPEEITIIPQEKISESNEIKWKAVGRKYNSIYQEARQYTAYANLLEDSGDKIIKVLLKFYFDSKGLDPSLKKVAEAINSLMTTIEWGSKEMDKNEFLSKVDALVDYIKEYGSE